ncbi:hypothetical protein, partial [Limosilactobacillus reuteri]
IYLSPVANLFLKFRSLIKGLKERINMIKKYKKPSTKTLSRIWGGNCQMWYRGSWTFYKHHNKK